jgi:predicted phage-related endonuclease
VLRFNEATLKAANNMEDYIEGFKVFEKDIENKIENDREVAIRIIDEYYNTARKMINQVR